MVTDWGSSILLLFSERNLGKKESKRISFEGRLPIEEVGAEHTEEEDRSVVGGKLVTQATITRSWRAKETKGSGKKA